MEDTNSNNIPNLVQKPAHLPTPTSAWLTFSQAFDASARHCQHIRQAQPDASGIGTLISDYLTGQHTGLTEALHSKLDELQLAELESDRVTRKVSEATQWAAANANHHLIGLDHPAYPVQLQETVNAPVLLYAKGDLAALAQPALAIVGSRKASKFSIDLTFQLAAAMAARGVTIVSGLARGIDAAAHEGALSVGGRTIAVAATSPEIVYPRQHKALEQRIISNGGLVVTEYPLGSKTLRWHFPRRNRIISGLSLGVLVAEAALPSGTLTTANHAIEQGREVMAIPGNVVNTQFRGCHFLIKQGATLVENEHDILDALAWPLLRSIENQEPLLQNSQPQKNLDLSFEADSTPTNDTIESQILRVLREAPASIDELMTHTQISIAELGSYLGILEIDGKIIASGNGRYNLRLSRTNIAQSPS